MPLPSPLRLMVDEVVVEDTAFSFGVANLQFAPGNRPAGGPDWVFFLK